MTVQDCAFFYEKKGRERKYETMIVFAGIALACVCYMNPDGTDDWCEPAGCDTAGSYCATDGSYCKLGRSPTCCSGLSCVNNECVSAACAKKTYVCNSKDISASPNCCDDTFDVTKPNTQCWDKDEKGCNKFDHCACPYIPKQGAWWTNMYCWWPYNNPYQTGQQACCSIWGELLTPEPIVIYPRIV